MGIPTIENLEINEGAYRIFWLMGIRDVNLKHHCKQGLKGYTFSEVNHNTTNLKEFKLDETKPHDAYYLCGVFKRQYWPKNFHLAFQYEKIVLLKKILAKSKSKSLMQKKFL